MGHIGHEPSTPKLSKSTFIELIPTAIQSKPKASSCAKRAHEIMETKPRFDGMRFDSQIFDLYVGPQKRHFAIHRAVLNQSPHFRSLCNTQALSRSGGAKAKTTLLLEIDPPKGMGHLLEYLYTNKFNIRAEEPLDEAKQLADLYLLASNYTLPGLQEAAISQLESSHISSKITAMQFFNMAEDLYSEEPHVVMREYFATAAPGLLRTIAEEELEELLRMISEGGDFATDLFAAHHQAFGPGHLPASHPASESQDGPLPKRVKKEEPPAGPVNIRTTWDDTNGIPSFWHEMSDADKLLVTMREEGKTWNEIDQALNEKHGKSGSITEWLNRYGRISINMAHMRLKKGDVDRFLAAKQQVEQNFQTEKWSLIADLMEENGAERYRPNFLQKKFKDLEIALKAREQAKAISIESSKQSLPRATSGTGMGSTNSYITEPINGFVNGIVNEAVNGVTDETTHQTTDQASGYTNTGALNENSPATSNKVTNGTMIGESAGNQSTKENTVVNGTASAISNGVANSVLNTKASNKSSSGTLKQPSDTPTTGTANIPAPKAPTKRPNTTGKVLPKAGALQRGNATTPRNAVDVQAEKTAKSSTTASNKGEIAQQAGQAKAGAGNNVGASKTGLDQKVADSGYIAHDDEDEEDADEDEDEDMSEDE